MTELNPRATARPDARLSRRSLVAAAGILAAAGPAAAGRALAFSNPKPPKFHWQGNGGNSGSGGSGGDRCYEKCVVCFLRGTQLLTPHGEVAIEALRIGDPVVTESGAVRAIRWIGRMTVERDADGHWPAGAEPIRVAPHTFGAGGPRRNLYLSRAHMLHLNGVLIPVSDLINGRTIASVDPASERLAYFHVEFDTHDIVVADGAPCESLRLEPASLSSFDNHEEYLALFGNPPGVPMTPYAPIAAHYGGRGELKSRLRSALAPIVDVRSPGDVVRDTVEAHALSLSRAA